MRAGQNVGHDREVAFVTRDFVEPVSLLREQNLHVQGLVQTVASFTVMSYLIVSGATRVNRSTRRKFSLDPMKKLFGEKLVVSTTSVSPSHRPGESPLH